MPAVAEPPKILGPGALIVVAKQLRPKSALTGSSSSEASIKPRYSRISRQHSHEGEPRDYNTEHFMHLRVIAAERNLLQTRFRIVKYYRVPSTQIIPVSLFSGSIKR